MKIIVGQRMNVSAQPPQRECCLLTDTTVFSMLYQEGISVTVKAVLIKINSLNCLSSYSDQSVHVDVNPLIKEISKLYTNVGRPVYLKQSL